MEAGKHVQLEEYYADDGERGEPLSDSYIEEEAVVITAAGTGAVAPVATGPVVNEVCCGGGKRVLNCIRKVYALDSRLSCGLFCALSWAVYATVSVLLSIPIGAVVAFARIRDGGFMGAFSLFTTVPLIYLFSVWYFRKPVIVLLFDEVGRHGVEFARGGERVIRRHMLVLVILIPSAALLMCVSFFSTAPLADIARVASPRMLGMTSVPVFLLFLLLVGVPIVFAATFSIVLSLLGLLLQSFARRLAADTRSVHDVITMHRHVQSQIDRHMTHWRPAFTVVLILTMLGFSLVFYTISVNTRFYPLLIPFASWLLLLVALLQVFFFWSVARFSIECSAVDRAIETVELSLAVTATERVVLGVHAASHKTAFAILGFTGIRSIDFVLGVFCFIGLFYVDYLVG
eukprot:c17881_g1_i1.p1 GENE.c17881_g1_i1~~c17881_g1_i1.p1  ORF type:complete len:402 (+),score=55.33 c17881_g1_i1:152-1357(+)